MDFVKVNSPWFRLIHDALPLIIQAGAGVALVHAVQEFSQAVERIEAAEAARSSFKVEREHWQPTVAGLIGRLLAKGSELSESARHEYPETPETTS
jgi:hypothetical protein